MALAFMVSCAPLSGFVGSGEVQPRELDPVLFEAIIRHLDESYDNPVLVVTRPLHARKDPAGHLPEAAVRSGLVEARRRILRRLGVREVPADYGFPQCGVCTGSREPQETCPPEARTVVRLSMPREGTSLIGVERPAGEKFEVSVRVNLADYSTNCYAGSLQDWVFTPRAGGWELVAREGYAS